MRDAAKDRADACAQGKTSEEQSTPSRREEKGASGRQAGESRSAAQSPRSTQAPQPKGVLNSILSPVLTLFKGNKDGDTQPDSTVLLQVCPLSVLRYIIGDCCTTQLFLLRLQDLNGDLRLSGFGGWCVGHTCLA
jgi:hypothetical protein